MMGEIPLLPALRLKKKQQKPYYLAIRHRNIPANQSVKGAVSAHEVYAEHAHCSQELSETMQPSDTTQLNSPFSPARLSSGRVTCGRAAHVGHTDDGGERERGKCP